MFGGLGGLGSGGLIGGLTGNTGGGLGSGDLLGGLTGGNTGGTNPLDVLGGLTGGNTGGTNPLDLLGGLTGGGASPADLAAIISSGGDPAELLRRGSNKEKILIQFNFYFNLSFKFQSSSC